MQLEICSSGVLPIIRLDEPEVAQWLTKRPMQACARGAEWVLLARASGRMKTPHTSPPRDEFKYNVTLYHRMGLLVEEASAK